MIVEWAYCPRLFHYMHVEGLMVANEHVWRGRHDHARTDVPGTNKVRRSVATTAPPAAPEPEAEPEVPRSGARAARSTSARAIWA